MWAGEWKSETGKGRQPKREFMNPVAIEARQRRIALGDSGELCLTHSSELSL